jgi:micrococcal nuclease
MGNMLLIRIRPIKILFLTFLTLLLSISCSNSQTLKCTRVVDGDTIILNNGERVRLIGIDTPETKHPRKPVEYFGKEASAFTKKMVEGKEVRLEYDWQQRDKYDRLLAYVYLMDGTFLNAEIIKQGYGHVYTKSPFKYLEQFRQYEKEARENKRGLWANKGPDKEIKYISERYVGSKYSNKYHFPHCTSAQRIKPSNRRVFNSVKEAIDAGYVPCKICRPPYYR